ncbi:MAG: cytidylate kinase-like family protein [Clostridia bacterium]|nr:cytidylate kinase-like family protein [Clostridia bacterium]
MNKIITISREFGSGGREIGKRLADELNYAYYDKEIIAAIAKETGLEEEYINNISERGIYPYAFQFAKSFSLYTPFQSNQTDILVAQQKIIKEIAKKGNCIIVGRGANVILKEYNPMNIFVYADMNSKINRCKQKGNEDEKLTDKELANKITQIDKNRKEYHKILSNLEWGEKENYHLCINTSNLEIKEIISPLAGYIKSWFRESK